MVQALQPVYGKNKFLLFRLLKDAETKTAAKLALQTEHTWTYERDTDSTPTKDGNVSASGGLEVELEITALSNRDDVNTMLFTAVKDDLVVEVWEVDISAETSGGKYKAVYAQGRLNSWELPNSVDSAVELSTTMTIDGKPQEGEATLTEEQKLLIDAAYKFRDTTVYSG